MSAQARLAEERKAWRKVQAVEQRMIGVFVSGILLKYDNTAGTTDLFVWDCIIPGKEGTPWENGYYPVTLEFPRHYPAAPPVAKFPANFLHVNVYPGGQVCLSILNGDPDLGGQWAPSHTVKVILLGIQDLLQTPNINSAAQETAYRLYSKNRAQYEMQVREQALRYPMKDQD